MTKDLIISANRHETKVAILEDEQLVEIYFQRANEYSLVGSIHKGRVTRVLPGMQSAFVDIGLERDAFLYVSDFFDESDEYEELPGTEKKTRSKPAAKKEKEREKEKEEAVETRKERRSRRSRRRRTRPEGLPESKYASVEAVAEEKVPREEEPAGGIVPLPGESLAKYGGAVPAEEPAGEVEGAEQEPESAEAAGEEAVPADAGEEAVEGGEDRESAAEAVAGEEAEQAPRREEAAEPDEAPAGREAAAGGAAVGAPAGEAEPAPTDAAPAEDAAPEHEEAGSDEPAGVERAADTGEQAQQAEKQRQGDEEDASAELRFRDEAPLEIDREPDQEESGDDDAETSGEETGGAGGRPEASTAPAEEEQPAPAATEAAENEEANETETAAVKQEEQEDDPAPAAGEAVQAPAGEQEEEEEAGEPAAEEDEDDRLPVRTKLLSHRRFTRPTRGSVETAGEDPEIQRMILDRIESPVEAAETGEAVEERPSEERKRGRRQPRRRGRSKNAANGEAAAAEEAAPAETESRRTQRSARRGRRRERSDEPAEAARTNGGRQNGPAAQRSAPPSITELLKEGQEIIVQVAKEPLGQKGARITSHIALPGRYVVYMPTLEHLGVSRKIASIKERQRLRRILQDQRKGMPGGFIIRTAGEGKSEEEIAADMKFLYNLWLDIREKAEKKKAPALLHHDLQVVERVLRDQVTEEFTSIWVDHEETYEEVLRFLERFQPELMKRVRLYTRSEPIFDAFNITQELEKALRPKVWLKSGGYIVINQTEALVAIDINTGKYVGKSNRLEDTIVKTNIEAVKEIVRQIRLRDLGGIIVVDFIDMEERKSRQKVMQALEEAMRADRSPYKILQFNDFGLVAITRKRAKQSLERTLCMPCPYCEGAAYVKSVETVLSEILNEAQKLAGALENNEDVVLRVHPDVAKRLKDPRSGYLEELEEILKRPVLVKPDPLLHHEKFDLV